MPSCGVKVLLNISLKVNKELKFKSRVIISVGSNAVAAYTRNNHACLRHKRFTDNDRDQQTYGSDRKRTQFFFPQCKNVYMTMHVVGLSSELCTIISNA
jgi:hypothetical protein